MKAAVDQIISNFSKSSENFIAKRKQTKWEKMRKSKILVPIAILIIIFIALSITLPMTIRNRDNGDDSSETTTEKAETSSPITLDTSTGSSSTETLIDNEVTTETPLPEILLFNRNAWMMKDLELKGKFKQLKPIRRIIVGRRTEDSCENHSSCSELIFGYQQNAYSQFDDVKENFIISSEGTIFEGRGFSREGQSTYDSHTSYNQKAFSISFLSNPCDNSLTEEQQTAFCRFIEIMLVNGDLDESFIVLQHNDLTGSNFDCDESILIESCDIQITKRKTKNIS